ncbi:MAG: hypothetical protein ACREGI_03935, partial [Candidatus Levyibacteriota bacterium]
ISALATNFWWVIFKPRIIIGNPLTDFSFTLDRFVGSPASQTIYFGLSLFTWALLVTSTACLPLIKIVFTLRKKILQPVALISLLYIVSLVQYLFLPQMHERYLFPFIPLMAMTIGLTGKNLWLFIAISLLNFLNLYLVWHPMVGVSLPYALMNNVNFQWSISVFTVILGLVLYVKMYKQILAKKT